MTQATVARQDRGQRPAPRSFRSVLHSMEVDTRLLGMVAALAIIWVGFDLLSGGKFLTPRNLWNLSVQSASIGIMATGMVLIIVSRNIDLSVGSMLGFLGYTMAMVQAEWIPKALGLGFDQPYTCPDRPRCRPRRRGAHRRHHGLHRRVRGRSPPSSSPWAGSSSGAASSSATRRARRSPRWTTTSASSVAGPRAPLGVWPSWILGLLACVGIVYSLVANRRRRRRYGFPVRPMWAEITIGVLTLRRRPRRRRGGQRLRVAGGPRDPVRPGARHHGAARWPDHPHRRCEPVLILIAVGLVMTIIATRRRFGRYVYAIGGNPEAAELGGINVKRTITGTFVLMGILCAISGAVQTARLNSAVTNLGIQNELDVISAAVIGGTSFAGGIGTIPGAILGAVVMQSLRSGMALLLVDSPTQDIVVGVVLVGAVGIDAFLRRRSA